MYFVLVFLLRNKYFSQCYCSHFVSFIVQNVSVVTIYRFIIGQVNDMKDVTFESEWLKMEHLGTKE